RQLVHGGADGPERHAVPGTGAVDPGLRNLARAAQGLLDLAGRCIDQDQHIPRPSSAGIELWLDLQCEEHLPTRGAVGRDRTLSEARASQVGLEVALRMVGDKLSGVAPKLL